MRFKYQEQIEAIEGCLTLEKQPIQIHAYILMHEKREHKDNFKPYAVRRPPRAHVPKDLENLCLKYALSLFDSAENLELHFANLKIDTPNIYKIVGNGLACGVIFPEDGESCELEANGHFNFFEYEGTDLIEENSPMLASGAPPRQERQKMLSCQDERSYCQKSQSKCIAVSFRMSSKIPPQGFYFRGNQYTQGGV